MSPNALPLSQLLARSRSLDWAAFAQGLGGIETTLEMAQLDKLSKDYYHFSPVLADQLKDYRGDLVVRPKTEAEVLKVAQACVSEKVALTVRGAGTGNYGQSVPLAGGVILDMSAMGAIKWIQPGRACVEPGAKLAAIDRQSRPQGWEIRMAPSTYRTATIGGFIGGGSGGIGSVMYGQLADRGNLQAVRVVTLEDHPQVIALRGDEVQQVNHAYGTNGILTELEIPLGPAFPWIDLIVVFDDFMQAARFGQTLGEADGIVKKLISIHAWPIPSYFAPLQESLPPGKAATLLMVSAGDEEALTEWVRHWGAQITYRKESPMEGKGTSLAEFTWNHTTLHARSADDRWTYLQTLFPYDRDLKLVEHLWKYFGDEVVMHLEYIRVSGKIQPVALQLVRYTSADRLREIIRYHEAQGAFIANPHTYLLEDGGRKTIDESQLQFKAIVDPYGLLNPGKMRGWLERYGG